ncbi:thymidylate synthase [uncultured Anaeromusa sp.]|uniref:thymidylate synthase n=1 Tax=uncultured Anaeromusa sp. TaxID=673273 RepID=UPI0029C887F9|nr:thymidylate synthase [uncultured Anaeromusa sp.]
MSKADSVFIKMCKDILENGSSSEGQEVRAKWSDGAAAHTIRKFGVINRYDLSREFPILTLRPINLKAAIDEMFWIWQKKSNNIKELNSRIWDSWANEEGSIGKAYGYQLGIKHRYSEGEFDQVDRVLYDLKHNPCSRRIIVNMYNHSDLHEMHLYPCAYSMTFNVIGKKLNAILNQRSQDVLVANNWNVSQYAILMHALAQISDLEVGEFIHVIADAHIYDRHIPLIHELIQRAPYPAPKLWINPDVKNFYDFKVEDFMLEDYQSGEQIKNIPVAI